jgi:hypothetical protein
VYETSVTQRLATVEGTVCYLQNRKFRDRAVQSGFLENLGFRKTLDESLGTVQAGVTAVSFLAVSVWQR